MEQQELISQVAVMAAEQGLEFEDLLRKVCKDTGISFKEVGLKRKTGKKLEEMTKEEILNLL